MDEQNIKSQEIAQDNIKVPTEQVHKAKEQKKRVARFQSAIRAE